MTTACLTPFTNFFVMPFQYATCCPAWLDSSAIARTVPAEWDENPWHLWNHRAFIALRESVKRGAYEHCRNCIRYVRHNNGLADLWQPLPDWANPIMSRGPSHLFLSNEHACNLHCWACRPELVTVTPNRERRRRIMNAVLDAFLPDAEFLSVLHSGEIFASGMHVDLLQRLNEFDNDRLRVELFTNGTLLADRWHTIAPAHDRIYRVKMSIDAATPATYETVRRGAKWSDLVRGLDLVRTLRESGRLAEFEATFVTRATNFRDVPAFVDLAIDHGATHVQFILLRQWPHIADDEFQRENLAHPAHPLRAEFEAILQDERLDHPHVHADNLKPALQTVIR